ncbi:MULTISPECIES: sugar ABC transporter substrate-binding protein [unclassified Nocardioides]|uniref:sugar ABC transporter substrate-binding protein n=1 Tax=unclassified Nocardioides TaxID=2615069 RepID=UPI0009F0FCA7|nr:MULTISPECIES: sugar ABC transporter substrate-binding protein [unclassified Nocardioides]GAW51837.1 hypothetical protein PD653B2_4186 [Nocardioides sp. PD653-B2]GAW53509.1 hypothetical protein PD653_0908 [Nocardioides sp. PD653]
MNAPTNDNDTLDGFTDWLGLDRGLGRRRFLARMGKSMLAVSAVGVVPSVLSACAASPSADGKYRVAFIIFLNNPYWKQTKVQVEKLLRPRLERQGVSVDVVNAAASADAVGLSKAIDSAVSQHYDGIIVAGIAPSMKPSIDRAVDKGIPVFTFCCDVADSDRDAFYGPDNRTIGADAAKLMIEGIQKEKVLEKLGLTSGVVGIETALGVESLLDRAEGFKEEFEKIAPPNITLLDYIDVQDDAKLVYSKSLSTMTAHPDLVGLYLSTGSQYALGNAIIAAGKTDSVIGVAHEVFEDTLRVMLKDGIWAVTNDAPIGQVIPPGDDMAAMLTKNKKPAQEFNYSGDAVKHYLVYASERSWISEELDRWDELFNGCEDGCDDLVAAELK